MILSQLALTHKGHCFVLLPEAFINQSRCQVGSTINIKSVKSDLELIVIWDGMKTDDDTTILDFTFAQANGFTEEPIVLTEWKKSETRECTSCRVEIIDSNHMDIINEHVTANVLDRSKLIYKDLLIPIWLTDHVKIIAKVIHCEPLGAPVYLVNSTEMQIQSAKEKSVGTEVTETQIEDPIDYVSYSLGLVSKPKFYLGNLLIQGPRGCGKTYLMKKICNDYSQFISQIFNCKQLRGKRFENIKKTLDQIFDKAVLNQPSIICLDDIDAFIGIEHHNDEAKGQETLYRHRLVTLFCNYLKMFEKYVDEKVVKIAIICSCRSLDSLDKAISESKGRTYFNFSIHLDEPNMAQRQKILAKLLDEQKGFVIDVSSEDLKIITGKCRSYMPIDLKQIVGRSLMNACSRAQCEFTSDLLLLKACDIDLATSNYTPINLRNVTLKRRTLRTFDDIGGMESIKDQLKRIMLLPMKYPKLYQSCPMKPQTSVLLHGPPGCGKTLLAEALTNQPDLKSICIRGPELLSKYVGSSEAAVRDLFKKAHLARPCVIFFDEFDSIVPKRGSDSTGVTDRVVNQFLTLMDGFEELSHDVFILAASSRPDMIDPAVLRSGRIDKHIYCPRPNYADRCDILRVLSSKMSIDNSNRILDQFAEKMDGYTGADIQSFLYSAQVNAIHDMGDDTKITVRERHLSKAFDEMKNSWYKQS